MAKAKDNKASTEKKVHEVSVARKDKGLRAAGFLFGLIALVHLIRLVTRFQASIGRWDVPLWVSSAALVLAGALSLWFFILSRD